MGGEGKGEEEVFGVGGGGEAVSGGFLDGGWGYGRGEVGWGFDGRDGGEVREGGWIRVLLGEGSGEAILGEFINHGETVRVGCCDDILAEKAVVGVSVVDD